MRKIAWIVFCVLVCSGLIFSQSITVTSPTANKVWFKGETKTITWTKSGSMANQVRIALVNEAASAVVQNIAMDTPNDGSYDWPLPMFNIPSGRFKIAIKVKGQNITGVSPAFDIRIKRSAVQPAPTPPRELAKLEPKVTITQPDSNDHWHFQETKDVLIETNFESHYFKIDLTSKGERVSELLQGALVPYSKVNSTHKYKFRWDILKYMNSGPYFRLRVQALSTQGEIEGISDSFYLSEDTSLKTSETSLQPSLIRARYSRRVEDHTWIHSWTPRGQPTYPNRSGMVRVGIENHYNEASGGSLSWNYCGFIFRSQIVFSFDEIKNKIQLPLKATLILQNKDQKSYETQFSHGAAKLYVLTSPWDGRAIDTPGYFYKGIPQTAGAKIEIDVLQQVKDWLNGTEENLGFLISAIKEDFAHNDEVCITFFEVTLNLRYLEKE